MLATFGRKNKRRKSSSTGLVIALERCATIYYPRTMQSRNLQIVKPKFELPNSPEHPFSRVKHTFLALYKKQLLDSQTSVWVVE